VRLFERVLFWLFGFEGLGVLFVRFFIARSIDAGSHEFSMLL